VEKRNNVGKEGGKGREKERQRDRKTEEKGKSVLRRRKSHREKEGNESQSEIGADTEKWLKS